MEESSVHLKRLHDRLGQLMYEYTRVQFQQFGRRDTWQPALNAYRCRGQITICVDLAGVKKEELDLRVEGRRLSLRGRREPPEPGGEQPKMEQILALEIDYGPFERQIELPSAVDIRRVRAEHREGLLWIYLPLLPEG
jgi:HSP20 family protein